MSEERFFSAIDLVGLPDLPATKSGIIRLATRDHWPFRKRAGRGGGREYPLSCLPPKTQLALLNKMIVSQKAEAVSSIGDLVPVNAPKNLPSLPNKSTLPSTSPIPEKARTIALARMDLVRAWEGYRGTHARATDADRDFISAYNNRQIFPVIHDRLGAISRASLYRYRSVLDNGQDWTRLVDNYYSRNKGSQLTEAERTAFMGFLLSPNKIKIGTAVKLTKFYLSKKQVDSPHHEVTFRRLAERFKQVKYDTWVLMREGQKALRDKVEPFIKRDPSKLAVGDVLVADGHRLNFQVINPFTGRPCRATLVGYVDWKSYDLAGFEIMVEENTQCIASALRNSILRLGRIPLVCYQDNGRAFRSRFFLSQDSFEEIGFYGLFARIGIIPVFAQPYNARAKIIEGWFKIFTETFERLIPSFTGSSIEDKPAWRMRNEKFHRILHNEYIPTIPEAIDLINYWLDFLRSQPCPHARNLRIGQVFEEGKGPGAPADELDDLMMTPQKASINRNGIRFLGQDYYNEALYGMREEVMIKYSLFDLSQVKVYLSSGEYLCTAKRVMSVHPMAILSATPAKDMAAVKEGQRQKRHLERSTIEEVKRITYAGGDIGRIEMDWQQLRPRAIDQIEQIEIEAKASPLPETMFSGLLEDPGPLEETAAAAAPPPFPGAGEADRPEPIFEYGYERYDWLMKQRVLTKEQRDWIAEYESSREFEILFGSQNKAAGFAGLK